MRLFLLFAAITVVFAGCQSNGNVVQSVQRTATPVGAKVSENAPVDSADPNRQVCRVTRQLGSNLTKRVCMTAAQQERARERAQEEMSRAQSSP
jgi:hypothetical protein